MSKPFPANDITEVVDLLYKHNKALAVHAWALVQECRTQSLKFREMIKTAKDVPGNYLTKRVHLATFKGRVSGLFDGLVVAGIITPVQAELLTDFAFALN